MNAMWINDVIRSYHMACVELTTIVRLVALLQVIIEGSSHSNTLPRTSMQEMETLRVMLSVQAMIKSAFHSNAL